MLSSFNMYNIYKELSFCFILFRFRILAHIIFVRCTLVPLPNDVIFYVLSNILFMLTYVGYMTLLVMDICDC